MLISLQSIHYDFDFFSNFSYIFCLVFFRWCRSLWLNVLVFEFLFWQKLGRAVKKRGKYNYAYLLFFVQTTADGKLLRSDHISLDIYALDRISRLVMPKRRCLSTTMFLAHRRQLILTVVPTVGIEVDKSLLFIIIQRENISQKCWIVPGKLSTCIATNGDR